MRTFPDENTPGVCAQLLSSDEAKAILAHQGGRIAEEAVNVIEEWFEQSPPDELTREKMLRCYDESIALYRRAGEEEKLRQAKELRDLIVTSENGAIPEPDLKFLLMKGGTLSGSWESDYQTDCLIIDGDLTIEGTLGLNHLDETRCVVVLGSVRADNLVCGGWVVVRDDLDCRHIHACSLNDGALIVGGNMKVETFLETGQYVQVGGDLDARFLGMVHNQIDVAGQVRCPDFERRADDDYLLEWIDGALLECEQCEDDDGQLVPSVHPTEEYDQRIASGGSPLRAGV